MFTPSLKLIPYRTGRGQGWPCRLFYVKFWENLLSTVLYLFQNTYSCRNFLQIFFLFIHNVKKWHLDAHFNYIMSKVQQWHHPTPLAQFYSYFRPPEGRRSPDGLWFTVWGGTSQDSNHFPVWGYTECQWQRILSWVRSLALFKWTDGTAPFWANS
jgi:hypothetical protein